MRPLNKPLYIGVRGNDAQGQPLPRYTLTHMIKQGGFGMVFRGGDNSLNVPVAVKANKLTDDPVFVERFKQEARTVASFKHPNIITVTDLQPASLPIEGIASNTLCFVMPFYEGVEDLDGTIRKQGKLTITDFKTAIDQQGSALSYAHCRGIVHRDYKPENVLVLKKPDGSIDQTLLSDFGLLKIMGQAKGQSMTLSGEIMGTTGWMSPEQLESTKTVDPRTDIYSLGLTAFYALTGEMPLPIGTSPIDAYRIATEYRNGDQKLKSLRSLRPEIPVGVENAIAQALAPNIDARTKDAKILSDTILAALKDSESPIEVRSEQPARRSSGMRNAVESPTLGRYARQVRQRMPTQYVSPPNGEIDQGRRKLIYVLGGGAVLAAVGALGAVLSIDNKPQIPQPPSPTSPPQNHPRIDDTKTTPSDPSTQTQTQQPRVEVVESGLRLTINGDYDQASIHKFVERDGRFIAERDGVGLVNPQDPAHVQFKGEPGRYQATFIYNNTKQFLVPIRVEQGRMFEGNINIPQVDPNDLTNSSGRRYLEQRLIYINDPSDASRSFFIAPVTLADQEAFASQNFLPRNNPELIGRLEQNMERLLEAHRSGRIGPTDRRALEMYLNAKHEAIFRLPCDPSQTESYPTAQGGKEHGLPYFRVNVEGPSVGLVPDSRRTRIAFSEMARLPLTGIFYGTAGDAINASFRHNITGITSTMPDYQISLPTQEQMALALMGGSQQNPCFMFGDNDTVHPQPGYFDQVTNQRLDGLEAFSDERVSPYGFPLKGGAPAYLITGESPQRVQRARLGPRGFLTETIDETSRNPTDGVAYVIAPRR